MQRLLQILFTALLLTPLAFSDEIVLRSGEVIEGSIMRAEGRELTIRKENGIVVYRVSELDPAWVKAYAEQHRIEHQQEKVDALGGLVDLTKGLAGDVPLSQATPFLKQYKIWVIPIGAGMTIWGLALCFFGWTIFKHATRALGYVGGIVGGLALGTVLVILVCPSLPQPVNFIVGGLIYILVGIPLAFYLARLNRDNAMHHARYGGSDDDSVTPGSIFGLLFGLADFAFFDQGVVWSRAIFGAILIGMGAYCAIVAAVVFPEAHLMLLLIGTVVTGLAFGVVGATRQMRRLRYEPADTYTYRWR